LTRGNQCAWLSNSILAIVLGPKWNALGAARLQQGEARTVSMMTERPLPKRVRTIQSKKRADVAQLVEQLIRNQQVIGSSPIVGSIFLSAIYGKFSPNLEMPVVGSFEGRLHEPVRGVMRAVPGVIFAVACLIPSQA
jgi:hypothetical protein